MQGCCVFGEEGSQDDEVAWTPFRGSSLHVQADSHRVAGQIQLRYGEATAETRPYQVSPAQQVMLHEDQCYSPA